MHSPVPPFSEQQVIVAAIERNCSDIDHIITQTHSEIELLREYRTRLIADVVTGKLDVRAAAAALPEEGEEPELPDAQEASGDIEEAEEGDLDDLSDETGS
jgi:type I restriction enzyme S subunit